MQCYLNKVENTQKDGERRPARLELIQLKPSRPLEWGREDNLAGRCYVHGSWANEETKEEDESRLLSLEKRVTNMESEKPKMNYVIREIGVNLKFYISVF